MRISRVWIAYNTRVELSKRFPFAIKQHGEDKIPLKLGVKHDLYQRCSDLRHSAIILALRDYCSGPRYLKNVLLGADRIDLDGNINGTVSEKHAEYAKKQLAKTRWQKQVANSQQIRQPEKVARRSL